ncbi:hypothetical protein CI102_6688 [Trichoderma harzianum]|nr:hypothetical protein CI102_6688 [Trichoderma harzianum]
MASLESSPKFSVDLMALKKRKGYLQHRADCWWSFQKGSTSRQIGALPACHGLFSVKDREPINKPMEDLVVETHEKNDCLTEVMIASAEKWLEDRSINLSAPLADIPVSLNYTVDVVRYDSSAGFSKFIGDVKAEDGVVPYVKTNIYVMLLSSGSSKDVWDRSINHYNKKVSAGGSTRGEGALLALGGRIATGSDMKLGASTFMSGQEGILLVCSPMARTLDYLIVRVFRTDSIVDPSPACKRALEMAEAALRNAEINDHGVLQMRFYMQLPRAIKYLHYLWVNGAKIDFILALPNALPAVPHNGIHDAVRSCGYTFFLNLIDYSADVMPVTHVDREKDQLPSTFDISRLNEIARGAYKLNNADNIHGLPVGVQVVGRRLEENMVLAAMKRAEDALGDGRF